MENSRYIFASKQIIFVIFHAKTLLLREKNVFLRHKCEKKILSYTFTLLLI